MSHPEMTSRLKARLRQVGMVAGTVIVIAFSGASVAVFSGILVTRAVAVVGPEPVPPVSVEVATVTRQSGYAIERTFIGQIEPPRRSALGFETGGTIAGISVQEGDRVAEGDLVARLDTRLIEADIASLEASRAALVARAQLADATAGRQAELKERGFASSQRFDETQFDLAATRAEIARIDAQLVGLRVRVEKAALHAPFSGRIGARSADLGEVVGAGQEIASLFDDAAPEFRVGLPNALASGLAVGTEAVISVNGTSRTASLRSLRPDIDPVTRTRVAIFELPGTASAFGQAGLLHLTSGIVAEGFWVPRTALVEATSGTWGLFGIDQNDIVTRHAVEILHIDGQRAFVSGVLEEGAQVVADGVHRVIAGQQVKLGEE